MIRILSAFILALVTSVASAEDKPPRLPLARTRMARWREGFVQLLDRRPEADGFVGHRGAGHFLDVRFADRKRPTGEILYQVNQTKNGYVVLLMNNRGVDRRRMASHK